MKHRNGSIKDDLYEINELLIKIFSAVKFRNIQYNNDVQKALKEIIQILNKIMLIISKD